MTYSDQIAYRAKHLVDRLGARDESPSRAARFAAHRYLQLMEQGRKEVYGYFTDDEVKLLIDRAWSIDWTIPDNYETFWARVTEHCEYLEGIHPDLGMRVRRASPLLIDTIVDMMREKKYANRQKA